MDYDEPQATVIVDFDKYDDHRIQEAKKYPCEECNAVVHGPCIPLNEYEKNIAGEWVHVQRESYHKLYEG